jgi:hypothetical protein
MRIYFRRFLPEYQRNTGIVRIKKSIATYVVLYFSGVPHYLQNDVTD